MVEKKFRCGSIFELDSNFGFPLIDSLPSFKDERDTRPPWSVNKTPEYHKGGGVGLLIFYCRIIRVT
jgi:hypothetical protein